MGSQRLLIGAGVFALGLFPGVALLYPVYPRGPDTAATDQAFC